MRIRAPKVEAVALPDLTELEPDAACPPGRLDGLLVQGRDVRGTERADLDVVECDIRSLRCDDVGLRGVRVLDTALTGLDGSEVRAPSSTLRDVELQASRLGSCDVHGSGWNRVRVSECRMGHVNLRGSTCRDVVFDGCRIDMLDLGGARVERVSFAGCQIGTLDVSGAQLRDVDLRGLDLEQITGADSMAGTVIDEEQLVMLAPFFARQLGITVV